MVPLEQLLTDLKAYGPHAHLHTASPAAGPPQLCVSFTLAVAVDGISAAEVAAGTPEDLHRHALSIARDVAQVVSDAAAQLALDAGAALHRILAEADDATYLLGRLNPDDPTPPTGDPTP